MLNLGQKLSNIKNIQEKMHLENMMSTICKTSVLLEVLVLIYKRL